MKKCALMLFGAAALSGQAGATAPNCQRLPRLEVDADGAPDSYRIDGQGLSYTCDGVFAVVKDVAQTQKNNPAGWQQLCRSYWSQATASGDYRHVKVVGFLMKSGAPVVQKAGDPFAGAAYVTTTSLTIAGSPSDAQRHYVNASEIPYVVISDAYARRYHLSPGDLVVLYRPKTGATAFAVYGDCCSMGEASVRAHEDLGNNPIVVRGGIPRAKKSLAEPVWIEVLGGPAPTPTTDWASWQSAIAANGASLFAAHGGVGRLKSCIARPLTTLRPRARPGLQH